MKNRIPTYAGRIKLTPVSGQENVYDLVRADEPIEQGTALNKNFFDYALASNGVTSGTATEYLLDDAFGGYTLVDGAKVNFRLHETSGENATLNVSGTGAKPIMANDAPMPSGIVAGTWLSATYSEVLDCYLLHGAINYDANKIQNLIPFIISNGFAQVAKGSYVGDGNGYIEINQKFYSKGTVANHEGRFEYTNTITNLDSFGRQIVFPFEPTIVIIYKLEIGEQSPIILFQGGGYNCSSESILPKYWYEGSNYNYNWSGIKNAITYDYLIASENDAKQIPIIRLTGNILSIASGVRRYHTFENTGPNFNIVAVSDSDTYSPEFREGDFSVKKIATKLAPYEEKENFLNEVGQQYYYIAF